MSERLPYEDEQWSEISVPGAEASWKKMERLLNKDKKRRRFIFWWWRYAAVGLVTIGLATAGWLWLSSADKKHEPAKIVNESITVQKEERKDIVVSNKNNKVKTPINTTRQNNTVVSDDSQPKNVTTTASEISEPKMNEKVALWKTEKTRKASQKTKVKAPSQIKFPTEAQDSKNSVVKKDIGNPVIVRADINSSPTDSIIINKEVKKESIHVKDSAKTIVAPPVVSNEDKKDQKKKKSSFEWSAGIGLQQAIAVNGQQSSSYNYNGKLSSLSDHIPSVYLRLQKDKWFAQAEFQYAVPQPVRHFYFSQKTRYDLANLSLNTERFTIQKLYYHQLPVSINYYVLPDLSVGAGGMYSFLAGAVTQQEVTSRNVQNGNETITRNLAPVKGFKDSFLYQTTAGILLQTDYHWKRFSLGLRYTQNLQPFIKYTKPDGAIVDEKTQALQAILRFRLWSSK